MDSATETQHPGSLSSEEMTALDEAMGELNESIEDLFLWEVDNHLVAGSSPRPEKVVVVEFEQGTLTTKTGKPSDFGLSRMKLRGSDSSTRSYRQIIGSETITDAITD